MPLLIKILTDRSADRAVGASRSISRSVCAGTTAEAALRRSTDAGACRRARLSML